MKPYPKYKPTDIDWIGEIPENWTKSKVKWELTFHNNRRVPIEADIRGNRQGEYPYYGASGIIDYVNDFIFDGEYILVGEDGANILSRSSPLAFLAKGKFWVNNHAHILKANNNQDNFYSLQIELNDFTTKASGSAQPKLTKEAIGDLELIVPPLPEQQAIVAFLDQKTALIDELIAKKERKIELLKEKRTALINHVVTKGLDTTVKYKDSGIDWIGEIPEHWGITKLRFVTDSVQTGSTPSTEIEEYFEGGDFDWYTPADFSSESIFLGKSKRKITKFAVEQGTVRLFSKYSVLLVGIGATLGKIGITNENCSSNQQINSIKFSFKVLPYYGAYYLFSNTLNISSLANFATLPILNQTQTKEIPFILPSIDEQQQIVEYLDTQTTLIDQNINLELQKIEKLKEYRQSLISNVVTGKIRVIEGA